MGPAVRAVMAQYTADVARYRRWKLATWVVTTALIVAAFLPFAVILLSSDVAPTVSALTFVNSGLLIAWLVWKNQILTFLGRPRRPHFPTEMRRIAEAADQRAATPQPFGAVPPDPRLRPRDW